MGRPDAGWEARRDIASHDEVTVMFERLRRRRVAPTQPPSSTTPLPGSGLQICPRCHAGFVHPVDWCEADDEHWWMLLRCGECTAEREVTIGDDIAKRYGEDLDVAQREIDRAAQRLDLDRMAAETEIFVQALERDLVDAGDFVRRIGC
jgi:hypothetical protein